MTVITKSPTHPAAIMFAAACAAYRTNNNEYVKVLLSPGGLPNKTLALQFLEAQDTLTAEDFAQGELVRQYCQGLTLKLLKNDTLSEFDSKLLLLSNQETINESNTALVAYSPVLFDRYTAQQRITDRLDSCIREHLGTTGDKITTTVEVIRSNYSKNYNCYFITTVTECNHNVFFSYREALNVNKKYSLKGTIKAHRDGYSTQLSRVKFDNKSEP
jgi:hypothetical protein